MKSKMPTSEEFAGAFGVRRGAPPPGAVEATLQATYVERDAARAEARSSRRWFWLSVSTSFTLLGLLIDCRINLRNAVAPVTIEGCGRPLSPGLYEYVPIPPRTADRVVWPTPIYRRKVWNV